MLYKQNDTKKLNRDLFRNPTAEYRGTPFWAWNCELEQKELEWQLEILKEMGFGGAHMHVRTGMATPYLSEEHMQFVKACVKKAKQEHMLAWLYDEDRWPSGPAGGIVTKDRNYRARYLLFTPYPYGSEKAELRPTRNSASVSHAGRTETGRLLACYDVELDAEGYLIHYHKINEHEEAQHEKWYAYLEEMGEITWWNGQTYVNTLDKAAIDRFIEVTYETYNREIHEEFGKTIPAIFTDEPQFPAKTTLGYAKEKKDVTLAWTDDFTVTYAQAYGGEDILSGIPELVWERADRMTFVYRYHYHDHVCERFVRAFADNCGAWCKEHGIALTGHMMDEPTLQSQTKALGEAMRNYRSFGIPGIDMLCANFEYTTAKQAQSVVHQYDKEGMLSELYGVTGWDFDFRGYKLHGDWQAALGVTVRVPHLSWVSMGGEAKRDYPASIHYQSPWWRRYSLIEDHFARVNTALSRGKAEVRVGVIHPIESYWLHFGPEQQTAAARESLDENFRNLTEWLLFGSMDFDFISESLLPELCETGAAPFRVGTMEYDIILVPGCETLRSTTVERLEQFAKAGGKIVFAGSLPGLVDAKKSSRVLKLAETSVRVPFQRGEILETLEEARLVELRNETGKQTDNLLCRLRSDGDGRWLFVAHGKEPENKHISNSQQVTIRVKGRWKATVYNTLTGETEQVRQCMEGMDTKVFYTFYEYDSLLLWLEPVGTKEEAGAERTASQNQDVMHRTVRKHVLPNEAEYTLDEPNVLVLDMAEYALEDGIWHPKEELLRVDIACRANLGWSTDIAHVAQPWSLGEETEFRNISLRWQIDSDIEYEGALLAIEQAEKVKLKWNGTEVSSTVEGWYVDKAICTIRIPKIQKGKNILEAVVPIGHRTTIEWAYILGDFGVEVIGKQARIVSKRSRLAFGDVGRQGLPFYGGNVTYHIPIETSGGTICVRSGYYVGAMQEVRLDDGQAEPMIYPPYRTEFARPEAGRHVLHLTLYGNRQNSFGPLHMKNRKEKWIGPKAWRTAQDEWCYEYMLKELGILVTPEIQEIV